MKSTFILFFFHILTGVSVAQFDSLTVTIRIPECKLNKSCISQLKWSKYGNCVNYTIDGGGKIEIDSCTLNLNLDSLYNEFKNNVKANLWRTNLKDYLPSDVLDTLYYGTFEAKSEFWTNHSSLFLEYDIQMNDLSSPINWDKLLQAYFQEPILSDGYSAEINFFSNGEIFWSFSSFSTSFHFLFERTELSNNVEIYSHEFGTFLRDFFANIFENSDRIILPEVKTLNEYYLVRFISAFLRNT